MSYRTKCKMYAEVNMGNQGDVPYCRMTGKLEPDCFKCKRLNVTNADHINAMSIKEKAAFLQSILTNLPWCKSDAPVDPKTKQCLIYDCDKCVIEWLRQEATADA